MNSLPVTPLFRYASLGQVIKLGKMLRILFVVPLLIGAIAGGKYVECGRGAQATASAYADAQAVPHPYFITRALFPPGPRLSQLIEPTFRASTVGADGVTLDPTWLGWLQRVTNEAATMQPIAAISWFETRTYMVSTLLRDTDSVSMARSLEVRPPLLDTPLVEFVSALPDAARVRPGEQKALLVQIVARYSATRGILAQRKGPLPCRGNRGCVVRCDPDWRQSFASIAPILATHLHADGVRAVWSEFLAGKTSWSRPWSLYVLNEWCRRLSA